MYMISGPIGVATTTYACTSSKCYGVDPAGQGVKLFKLLQTQVNRFASLVGFKSITVDGDLGVGTRDAVRKIAEFVYSNMVSEKSNAVEAKAYTESNKTLAENAQRVIDFLDREATLFRLTGTPTTTEGKTMATTAGFVPVIKCTATICYSADGAGKFKGTDALLRQLQSLLNAFASKTGKPVSVDGFIGAGTVTAAKAVVAFIKSAAPEDIAVAGVLEANTSSKEILAKTVQSSIDLLTREAAKFGLAPGSAIVPTPPKVPSKVPIPTPDPTSVTPADVTPAAVTSTFEAVKSKWPYYVGGAAVAGGLFYLIWTLTAEPKKASTSGKSLVPSEAGQQVRGLGRGRARASSSSRRRASITGFDRRFAYGRR